MSGTNGTTPSDTSSPTQTEPVWAKPSVSVYALTIFMVAFAVAYFAKDGTSIAMMMGAAIGMAQQTVNYWLGSSSSSTKKDATIAAQITPLTVSTPATTVVSPPTGPIDPTSSPPPPRPS